MITVDTKLVALLGTPLRQSISYKLQNDTYQALGLDYYYIPVEVEQDGFEAVVNAVRYMNFAGLAITKPYKVTIMQYLDEVDDIARMMGSCNTVVVKDGKFKGYNTDGLGCLRSLVEEGSVEIKDNIFFSFGAGGTGKSVCFELANNGARRIYICSRSAMCEELAANINNYFPGVCVAIRAADEEKIRQAVSDANVLLNLSGSGMYPHIDETPVDKALLQPKHICFDATYNPDKTRFLLEAEEKGCKIINGIGMVIYQGARQIKLWTGKDDPVEIMRKSFIDLISR